MVVVGAGPAGAASAIALRRRGLAVALLERAPLKGQGLSIGESISASAQYALRDLGLWEMFKREPHRPSYVTQSAWGSDELREKNAIRHTLGPDFHVDRERFDAWLRQQALALGADWFGSAAVDSAVWDPRRFRFVLTCTASRSLMFDAQHVIDATGRSAWLLRRLGGRVYRVDDLIAVGRWYDQAQFEPSILVEATPTGWWYSGPLPDRRALAFHVTFPESAAGARRMDGWQRLLRHAPRTASRLASATLTGPVRVCSATPMLGEWNSDIPFLAVGDAAAAFDPISGSGLCFAFRSALEAAAVLCEARSGRGSHYLGYQQGVRNVFNEHLHRRSELYRHERRWKTATFWARLGIQSLWKATQI